MTPITLESIKADADALAAKIASFEAMATAQAKEIFFFPESTIELNPNEHYAGLIVGKDGEPCYHLILLPGQANKIDWSDAITWAKGQGGELPTRREQSLLYANLKEQFDPNWYWSADTYEQDSAYAWFQDFSNGNQTLTHKDGTLRARAVRRLPI